jgi:hypothetical protein
VSWPAATRVVDQEAGGAGGVDWNDATWPATTGGFGAAMAALGGHSEAVGRGGKEICGGRGEAGSNHAENSFAPMPCTVAHDRVHVRLAIANYLSEDWEAEDTEHRKNKLRFALLYGVWSFPFFRSKNVN